MTENLTLPAFLDRKRNPVAPATVDERRAFLGDLAGALDVIAPAAKPATPSTYELTHRVFFQGVKATRGTRISDGWHSVGIEKRGRKWIALRVNGKRVRMTVAQWKQIKEASDAKMQSGKVMLATEDSDAGIVPASKAKAEAQALADETGQRVTVRDPVSDKVLNTVKPKQGVKKMQTAAHTTTAPSRAKKVAAKSAPKRKVAKRAAPKSASASDKATTTDRLVKLAQRKQGVSPAELNSESGWTGAPWKWLFENSKGTGWSQRRGLKFKVVKTKEGETRYHLSK